MLVFRKILLTYQMNDSGLKDRNFEDIGDQAGRSSTCSDWHPSKHVKNTEKD